MRRARLALAVVGGAIGSKPGDVGLEAGAGAGLAGPLGLDGVGRATDLARDEEVDLERVDAGEGEEDSVGPAGRGAWLDVVRDGL